MTSSHRSRSQASFRPCLDLQESPSPDADRLILGARVYYLRSILHDWSSQKCVQILGRVREAMKPGYSKLLLNEFILPAKNVPLYPALLDINMMALLNGKCLIYRCKENLQADARDRHGTHQEAVDGAIERGGLQDRQLL